MREIDLRSVELVKEVVADVIVLLVDADPCWWNFIIVLLNVTLRCDFPKIDFIGLLVKSSLA